MAKRQQPPKRLFKGREHVSAYSTSSSPTKLMKQVSRDHLDVLQNIESTLASRYREDPAMDDRTADAALRASLAGTQPDEPRAAALVAALQAIREFHEDITDEVWYKALRVVEDSVRTHSSLAPGDTGYFEFIKPYIV
jgi:hypothetical protein